MAAERSPGLSAFNVPTEFFMYEFKVQDCPVQNIHDKERCPFRHAGDKHHRRHPSCHSAKTCPAVRSKKVCPRGASCPFAHNLYESFLHPDKFRTKICSLGMSCNRPICFFAHQGSELRSPPFPASPSPVTTPPGSPHPLSPYPSAPGTPTFGSPLGFSLADLDMTYVMAKLAQDHMAAAAADGTTSVTAQPHSQQSQEGPSQHETLFLPMLRGGSGVSSHSLSRDSSQSPSKLSSSASPPIVAYEDATSVDRLLAQANLVAIAPPAGLAGSRQGSPFCRSPRDTAWGPGASAVFADATGNGTSTAAAGGPWGSQQQQLPQFMPVLEMQQRVQQGPDDGVGVGLGGDAEGAAGFGAQMAMMRMPVMQLVAEVPDADISFVHGLSSNGGAADEPETLTSQGAVVSLSFWNGTLLPSKNAPQTLDDDDDDDDDEPRGGHQQLQPPAIGQAAMPHTLPSLSINTAAAADKLPSALQELLALQNPAGGGGGSYGGEWSSSPPHELQSPSLRLMLQPGGGPGGVQGSGALTAWQEGRQQQQVGGWASHLSDGNGAAPHAGVLLEQQGQGGHGLPHQSSRAEGLAAHGGFAEGLAGAGEGHAGNTQHPEGAGGAGAAAELARLPQGGVDALVEDMLSLLGPADLQEFMQKLLQRMGRRQQ